MRGEHLAGDLGVTGLVGAYQAELVAAEDGDEAVEEEKGGYSEEDDELAHGERSLAASGGARDRLRGRSFAGGGGLLTIVHLFRGARQG